MLKARRCTHRKTPRPARPNPKLDSGKPKLDSGSWPLIQRLVRDQGRQHLRGYLIALALMGVVAAMTALAAWLMRDVINRIFVEANYAAIWYLSGAIIVIFVVKGFASWGHAVVLAHIGNRIIAETQTRVFDRLLGQGVGFYCRRHLGRVGRAHPEGRHLHPRRSRI